MSKDKNNKLDILESIVDEINSVYGDGSILRSNEKAPIETISTGSYLLDDALGAGGFPKGMVTEIYGAESTGKSTICLQFLAQIDPPYAFLDGEHAFDKEYAKKLGVDVDSMLIAQPNSLEDALDMMIRLTPACNAIILDSVAALPPKSEIEGDIFSDNIGSKARKMSQVMRILVGAAHTHQCSCVFVNQIREKIGVMYGSPTTTPGGKALKFASAVRVELGKGQAIKAGENILGTYIRAKIVKNKTAAPYGKVQLPLIYGKGVWAAYEILDMALATKVIKKAGSWFKYEDSNLGQGSIAAAGMIDDHPELAEKLLREVIDKTK